MGERDKDIFKNLAIDYLDAGNDPVLRSCWNCNPSHEHLKNVDYVIYCFACNNYFFKGHLIPVEETE